MHHPHNLTRMDIALVTVRQGLIKDDIGRFNQHPRGTEQPPK
jgi:hypothetical protein